MAALARTLRSLVVALLASLVVAGPSGAMSFDGLPAEARPAEGVVAAVAVEAGAEASAAGKTDCPCPSELQQADCDDAPCTFGLVQDPGQGSQALPAGRGGVPPDYLFGLARGPEPTPPRSFG